MVFLIILIIVFSVYFFQAPLEMDGNIITLILIVDFSVILFFLYYKRYKLNESFFVPSVLLLLGYVIVHFQYPIDYVLGNIDRNLHFVWVDNRVVLKALVASSIGLFAFVLGYIIFANKKYLLGKRSSNIIDSENRDIGEHITVYRKKLNLQNSSIVGLLLIGSILLILYFYFANPIYFLNGYGYVELGSTSEYVISLFDAIMFASIIQKSRNIKSVNFQKLNFITFFKQLGFFPNLLIIIYLFSVLISGDRGALIFYSVLYVSNFIYVTHKEFQLWKILSLIVVSAFIFTLLGKVRALDSNESLISRTLIVLSSDKESRFGSESFSPFTQNLALSNKCLHYSIAKVPNQYDHFLGHFQLQQILSIIPFSKRVLDDYHWRYDTSSNFITWLDQGEFPYSGLGTTITSDFYLDFGIIGIIIGMLMVGYVYKYADDLLYQVNNLTLFSHSLFVVLFSSAIYMSRSSFLISFKLICWTFIFLIINKFLFNKQ